MMFFSEVLPKEAQVPACFKSFVAVMCESVAESLSDTDVEIVYWNLVNKFLHIVTCYQTDGRFALLWTDEELARIRLSCHNAGDYLGVHLDEL